MGYQFDKFSLNRFFYKAIIIFYTFMMNCDEQYYIEALFILTLYCSPITSFFSQSLVNYIPLNLISTSHSNKRKIRRGVVPPLQRDMGQVLKTATATIGLYVLSPILSTATNPDFKVTVLELLLLLLWNKLLKKPFTQVKLLF